MTVVSAARRQQVKPRIGLGRQAAGRAQAWTAAMYLGLGLTLWGCSSIRVPASLGTTPQPQETQPSTSLPAPTPTASHAVFTAVGPMGFNHGQSSAVLLDSGSVLLVGGLVSAEIYDPGSAKFRATGPFSMWVDGATAVEVQGGRILIVGVGPTGQSSGQQVTDVSYAAGIYDPSTDRYDATGPRLFDTNLPAVAPLRNGNVLFVGGTGQGGGANASAVSHAAELFDPSTGRFTQTGSMHTYREGFTATTLQDGRVLVAGGDEGDVATPVGSAELYDAVTAKFSPTGSMHAARAGATSTLLESGKVLIVGGKGADGNLASAELFDPQTGEFTPTGSMATERLGHTATMLKDGRVLVVGGGGTQAGSLAEIYDPATGVFSPTGQLGANRSGHTATLLKDGRVLIAGGDDTGVSAEIYWP